MQDNPLYLSLVQAYYIMVDVNDILFLDSSESFSGSSNVYHPGKLFKY